MSRPRKQTLPITIELLPRHKEWLATLLSKTHYGNSIEQIALNLLNDRFKQLQEQGELLDSSTSNTTPIPFPTHQPTESSDKISQPTEKKLL